MGQLTFREFWTVVHGMLFGAIYLLAFAGGLADLWSLKPKLITQVGYLERLKRLRIGMWIMTFAAWGTVLTGTYVVYPWYREKTPTSPRNILLANSKLSQWHTFGMEWKEHIGWLCPILITVVAFIITYYGEHLIEYPILRKSLLIFFILAFIFAGIAGVYGAFITKIVPIH